jgi:hypothetical protein
MRISRVRGLRAKVMVSIAALGLALGLTGCIGAPVVPPLGVLYTDIDAPLSLVGETGMKRGEASVTAILGLVSTGDGSVKAAAQAGGITRVKHVDYEFTNVIGVYQRYTTVVYGD